MGEAKPQTGLAGARARGRHGGRARANFLKVRPAQCIRPSVSQPRGETAR
jgi:hypothetical protein